MQVLEAVGEPIMGHGETTSRGRRRHVRQYALVIICCEQCFIIIMVKGLLFQVLCHLTLMSPCDCIIEGMVTKPCYAILSCRKVPGELPYEQVRDTYHPSQGRKFEFSDKHFGRKVDLINSYVYLNIQLSLFVYMVLKSCDGEW